MTFSRHASKRKTAESEQIMIPITNAMGHPGGTPSSSLRRQIQRTETCHSPRRRRMAPCGQPRGISAHLALGSRR